MSDQATREARPQGVEPDRDTDYEALELLADIDAAEAAELTAYKAALTLSRERTLTRTGNRSAEETSPPPR